MSVETAVEDWVGTVLVDDYAPLSQGDWRFAQELRDAVVDLSDDDHVKVVILRARGSFAPLTAPTGVDAATTFTARQHQISGSAALYQALTFSKKITLTEVSGECAGAGTNLVLASDLTIAAEGATFGSPFRGGPEANFVLAALTVRLNRAKAWVLRDTVLGARTAFDVGLVNDVVPPESLRRATDAAAARVARMPLDGVVMSKMLHQAVLDASGVGREFDMAAFYASALSTGRSRLEETAHG